MGIQHAGETFRGMRIPKRTPKHPTKSHAVLIGTKDKPIIKRFGEQGAKTNQSKSQRDRFRSRHQRILIKAKSLRHTGLTRLNGKVTNYE